MKQLKGFTLIELMIVVAIIGILASVALPAYQAYTKKAKFSEVIMATSAIKSKVDVCFQTRGNYSLDNCDSFSKIGGSAAGAELGQYVSDVTIETSTAKITATATAAIDDHTFILTPTASNSSLTWNESGTCMGYGIC